MDIIEANFELMEIYFQEEKWDKIDQKLDFFIENYENLEQNHFLS